MFAKRIPILSAAVCAILGVISVMLTGWLSDVLHAVWIGDDIDSSSAFFAITNISAALFVVLLYYIYSIDISNKVRFISCLLSFLIINVISIIYLIKFSYEFANMFGQSLVMSLVSLIFACSGGALISFGILQFVSILAGKGRRSNSERHL